MKKHRCLTVLQGFFFLPLFPEVPLLSHVLSCLFPELLLPFLEDFFLSTELLSLSPEPSA